MRISNELALALALLGAAGCFSPTFNEGQPCTADGDCPGDMVCAADNNCYSEVPDLYDAAIKYDAAKGDGGPADAELPPDAQLGDHCGECGTECSAGGGRCVTLDGDLDKSHCVMPCPGGEGDCPEGFGCTDIGSGDECVPLTNSCRCRLGVDGGTRPCENSNDEGSCDGTETCGEASGWGECSALVPSVDVCDGIDNDCNDTIDDDYIVGGSVTFIDWDDAELVKGDGCGTGACVDGQVICDPDDDRALTCSTLASVSDDDESSCNNTDDDCNGIVDDAFSGPNGAVKFQDWDGSELFKEAVCGTGDCADGRVKCLSETELYCDSIANATSEVCDNADNNCEGNIDEACWPPASAGSVRSLAMRPRKPFHSNPALALYDRDGTGPLYKDDGCGLGDCEFGKVACDPEDDSRLTCDSWDQISADYLGSCDDHDNDCDGIVDNAFVEGEVQYWDIDAWKNKDAGCGVGQCANGTVVCDGPNELTCDTLYLAASDDSTCDDVDDDCNDVVDDDFINGTITYLDWNGAGRNKGDICGIGACANGAVVCADTSSLTCTTIGLSSPDDTCNDFDENCNGIVDDVFAPGGSQSYLDWDGTPLAKGAPCGTGACADGEVVCESEAVMTCNTSYLATLETDFGLCDAEDNDCDGMIDEACVNCVPSAQTGEPDYCMECDPGAGVECGSLFDCKTEGNDSYCALMCVSNAECQAAYGADWSCDGAPGLCFKDCLGDGCDWPGWQCSASRCVPDGMPAQPNYVFVTSQSTSGSISWGGFTGIEGADELCNSLASTSLPGTYVAWLSTSTEAARDRLGVARGWTRPDGKPFADTVADISMGRIYYPPRIDETGTDVGDTAMAWTGTNGDGTPDLGGLCGDWTNTAVNGRRGEPSGTRSVFSFFQQGLCDVQHRIYCFGVNQHFPMGDPPPPAGIWRFAFATQGSWLAGGGISPDSFCQIEADGAGLPGSYLAMLATTSGSAASRFDTNPALGPWVRVDGVPITDQPGDLFTAELWNAPINLTANGQTYVGAALFWNGANSGTMPGNDGSTCSNWTSADAAADGAVGYVAFSSRSWVWFGLQQSCDVGRKLICLQQ